MEVKPRGSGRVVFLTGASTGFGRLATEALARRGHTVFAGVRDVGGRNREPVTELLSLAGHEGLALQVVELDVTSQESADRAAAAVMDTAGRIDAVVNNAGVVYAGPLEAYTAEEAHRQFDVNVVGALRVNRAAIPYLRRQGRGVLIQISSTADRVTVPFTGLYSASKAALAALTEAWRMELFTAGIESVSVEPAPHAGTGGNNGFLPADGHRMTPYLSPLTAFMEDLTRREKEHDRDPKPVVDAIVGLVEATDGTRPHRTVIGPAPQVEAVTALNHQASEVADAVGADMGILAHMPG